jgi:hypothetical protein
VSLRAMRVRVAGVIMGGGGKDPIVAPTIDNATISPVRSIPPLPPSTMTAIAAIDECHCCCHSVDNDNRQKPAVIVCCWRRQWQSSLTEVAVDGGHGNGGLC